MWFCRIARKHFAAVRPYRSDGLTLTLAGVKDMNVLFSNFAFAIGLRGICQVMEAAQVCSQDSWCKNGLCAKVLRSTLIGCVMQADPDLVFKLQVSNITGNCLYGCASIHLIRAVLLLRLPLCVSLRQDGSLLTGQLSMSLCIAGTGHDCCHWKNCSHTGAAVRKTTPSTTHYRNPHRQHC